MALRSSFRFCVLLRVSALAVVLYALLWSTLHTSWDAVPVVSAVLLVLLLVELVRYVERGTRDLAALLRSVAAGDFTTTQPRRAKRPPFSDYEHASRMLIDVYRKLDLQRAASDALLRAAVEHVGVGLLCFTAVGRVVFANPRASALLGRPDAASLDAFTSLVPDLPQRLFALGDDDRLQVELPQSDRTALLVLHARHFSLLGESYTVVVMQDMREELESRDLEAWQSLTRVLTHEMVNSLTPIVTLSRHLQDTLVLQQGGTDVAESVEVIHERSSGLVSFIEAYRQFANPPAPAATRVSTRLLVDHVVRLMRPELEKQGIALHVVTDEAGDGGGDAWVDARQIEQILINLIRNAQQALAGRSAASIELRAIRDGQGRALIQVSDNGPGIPRALEARVFMPFFSTRKGGTGVGLALSRQLARLNGGTLTLRTGPDGCRFTLRLPFAR